MAITKSSVNVKVIQYHLNYQKYGFQNTQIWFYNYVGLMIKKDGTCILYLYQKPLMMCDELEENQCNRFQSL